MKLPNHLIYHLHFTNVNKHRKLHTLQMAGFDQAEMHMLDNAKTALAQSVDPNVPTVQTAPPGGQRNIDCQLDCFRGPVLTPDAYQGGQGTLPILPGPRYVVGCAVEGAWLTQQHNVNQGPH